MFISIFTYSLLCFSLLLNMWLLSSPSARAKGIATWIHLMAEVISKKRWAVAVLILVPMVVGCDQPQVRVVALPVPAAETPPCNLPAALHKQNWRGQLGQGSCVHASLTNHLRWLNQFEEGEAWRNAHGDGEYASRLMSRLDDAGFDYIFTQKSDPRFLDYVSEKRIGCILWWKPSHCCTFQGWVTDANGQQYAAILDNNYPGKIEYTSREQFVRLWSGYGGFALSIEGEPATSIPYLSYRVVN